MSEGRCKTCRFGERVDLKRPRVCKSEEMQDILDPPWNGLAYQYPKEVGEGFGCVNWERLSD